MRISVLCGKPKKGVSSIDCRIIVTTFIDERCSFVCFFFAIITCFASKTADYLFFLFQTVGFAFDWLPRTFDVRWGHDPPH